MARGSPRDNPPLISAVSDTYTGGLSELLENACQRNDLRFSLCEQCAGGGGVVSVNGVNVVP